VVENLRGEVWCVECNGMCPYVKANAYSDLELRVFDNKL